MGKIDYIYGGDVISGLSQMGDGVVRCCVTSPPYYGLRDYGVDGQIGLEETPEAYIERLVGVFREVRRVLADDGTLWVNIGDSYWGGKGASAQAWSTSMVGQRETINGHQHQLSGKGETRPTDRKHPEIKPKDLIGIPWMLAFALRSDGWWLRQDIIWHKPNPMPESVKDRCTKSHEYIFLLSKSKKYFYDADSIRTPHKEKSVKRYPAGGEVAQNTKYNYRETGVGNLRDGSNPLHDKGANKRSVWSVTTKPFKGAHFAVFPPDLIEPCILAGSERGDVVLDPFMGSGTTAEVAIKHGRHYLGCEINADYIDIAKKRLQRGVQTVLL